MVRFVSTSLLALTLATAGTASMAQPAPQPCHGERCEKPPIGQGEGPRHEERRDHDRWDAPREEHRDHDQRRDMHSDHDQRRDVNSGRDHDQRRDHDRAHDQRRDHDGTHDQRRDDNRGQHHADRNGDHDRGEHRGNDHCKPGDRNCNPPRPN